MAVNLCTFNVRGLGNELKRDQIFFCKQKTAYDICLLQESHLLDCKIDEIKREWDGNVFFERCKLK